MSGQTKLQIISKFNTIYAPPVASLLQKENKTAEYGISKTIHHYTRKKLKLPTKPLETKTGKPFRK